MTGSSNKMRLKERCILCIIIGRNVLRCYKDVSVIAQSIHMNDYINVGLKQRFSACGSVCGHLRATATFLFLRI